mmetsp:Transcript_79131/g.144329  ORF Transcript_79131/g.144329 Transcript_79131/m.144329 type:complete len:261 (+) Transcript_79131:74-856(+)
MIVEVDKVCRFLVCLLVLLYACAAAFGLGFGISKSIEIDKLVLEKDFELSPSVCNITELSHDQSVQCNEDGRCRCKEKLDYKFTHEGQEYQAKRYEKNCEKRITESDCDCFWDSHWTIGEVVDCWMPKVEQPSEHYECGNDACIKIFNPKKEIEEKSGLNSLCIFGIVFGALTVCTCCLCVYLAFITESFCKNLDLAIRSLSKNSKSTVVQVHPSPDVEQQEVADPAEAQDPAEAPDTARKAVEVPDPAEVPDPTPDPPA